MSSQRKNISSFNNFKSARPRYWLKSRTRSVMTPTEDYCQGFMSLRWIVSKFLYRVYRRRQASQINCPSETWCSEKTILIIKLRLRDICFCSWFLYFLFSLSLPCSLFYLSHLSICFLLFEWIITMCMWFFLFSSSSICLMYFSLPGCTYNLFHPPLIISSAIPVANLVPLLSVFSLWFHHFEPLTLSILLQVFPFLLSSLFFLPCCTHLFQSPS